MADILMLIIDNYGVVLIGNSKIHNINVYFNLFKTRRKNRRHLKKVRSNLVKEYHIKREGY